MIEPLVMIILGVLFLASILDVKYKAVPSVVLTGALFLVLFLRPENLIFGIIAFVFSILIRDIIDDMAGLEFGIADIKILTIMGLLAVDMYFLVIMIVVFLLLQFVYTLLWRWRVNKDAEMPFIPCLFFVYIAMILLGGVA